MFSVQHFGSFGSNQYDHAILWSPPIQGHHCVDQFVLQWVPYHSSTISDDSTNHIDISGDSKNHTMISGDSTYHTIIPGDSTEYLLDNLDPCTPYRVSLTPLSLYWGSVQNGSSAEITAETLAISPGPVGDLRQVSSTPTSVTIGWTRPAVGGQCVGGYRVMVEEGAGEHRYEGEGEHHY